MKTKLEATRRVAGIMVIAIITLAIIGCKQDASPTPQAQPSVTINGKTIPVTKAADVSDADFNTTLTNLKTAIDGLNPGTPAKVAANTDRIEIGGTGVTLNARVLRIEAKVSAAGIASNLETIYASLSP